LGQQPGLHVTELTVAEKPDDATDRLAAPRLHSGSSVRFRRSDGCTELGMRVFSTSGNP